MTILKLWRNYKPAQFFGCISFFLLLISAAVFVPAVLVPYIYTGVVAKFPTLIVCGFIVISALLSFFTGTVLQNLIEKEKREFEFRLQLIEQKEKRCERVK